MRGSLRRLGGKPTCSEGNCFHHSHSSDNTKHAMAAWYSEAAYAASELLPKPVGAGGTTRLAVAFNTSRWVGTRAAGPLEVEGAILPKKGSTRVGEKDPR